MYKGDAFNLQYAVHKASHAMMQMCRFLLGSLQTTNPTHVTCDWFNIIEAIMITPVPVKSSKRMKLIDSTIYIYILTGAK